MTQEGQPPAPYEFSRSERLALFALALLFFIGILVRFFILPHFRRSSVEVVSAPAYAHRIDLNTAPAAEIELLPGIGPAKARKIVELRNSLGRFDSLSQLSKVLGPKVTEQIAPLVILSPAAVER